jgi:hypothetical protein
VLGAAAAMVATPALAQEQECRIGPPPHDKGPLVWMNLDQVRTRCRLRPGLLCAARAPDQCATRQQHLRVMADQVKRAIIAARADRRYLWGNETPEFQRQNRDFVAAVRAAGKAAELVEAQNYNHFEMGESLANPYGPNGRAALALMQLKPA